MRSLIHSMLFSLGLLCAAAYAHAQQITNVNFIGRLSVEGGGEYAYKLYVTDSAGQLTGYSITDIGGPNETKTWVRGSINKEKKTLTFHETKVAYTKTKQAAPSVCLLAATLRYSNIKGTASLRGKFVGKTNNSNADCGKGKIMLLCADELMKRIMQLAEKDTAVAKLIDSIQQTQATTKSYTPPPPDADIPQLLPGNSTSITCAASQSTIEIWDAKSIDGDVITLWQDGKPLLENYKISGRRKSLYISTPVGSTTRLRLAAISEGAEPLNTARLRITSGTTVQYIDATTTPGRDVFIILQH